SRNSLVGFLCSGKLNMGPVCRRSTAGQSRLVANCHPGLPWHSLLQIFLHTGRRCALMTVRQMPRGADQQMDISPHILVVDDHHEIRDLLAKYLARSGLRVTAARDSQAARNALKA